MTPEQFDDLTAAYGLGGSAQDVQEISHRGELQAYAFRVGDRRYIAKPDFGGWDEEHRRFKFGVQRHLHASGFPIPAIHLTRAGESIWDPDGAGVILTDYVGEPHAPARKGPQCAAAAAALGWFHRIGREANDIGTHYWDVDEGFEYAQAFVHNARGWLPQDKLSPENCRRAIAIIDQVHAILRPVRAQLILARWWQLPHIPVHGEYCQFHCRYDGDEVVGVIDWDTVRLAPRIHDVARAIDIGLGWSEAVPDYYGFQWRYAHPPTVDEVVAWMRCYLETAPPLTAWEVELFPYVCCAMWGTAGPAFVPRADEQLAGCERVVDFMRFWRDEASSIQQALAPWTKSD